ncbi:BMP family ABC transporter substrate-binding protein [Mycoplasma phocimorsus]|uniref:BMP family ABC transporter substrate-binding protein n=1 Tax=Mycoplasma phocimorsus TaxID=3045839 RepID=A0AAJ1PTP8_9MOLU|nr:BMP family ABC transporter substrate-binding protein [Mycoplasma phocimorsus]MDJ1645666.1 BMP family ABC transporter substrate-binding protein [Mycoplasma phocimorsus]MDJ1646785.1 BMP family ABC transporter substrate-binding protein [Mycoplasma phocimorsus]
MRKNKLLLFGLSVASIAIAPITVSCSFGSSADTYAKSDVANITSLVKEKDAEIKAAIQSGSTKHMDIVLLTAGGKVNDLSFNQSVWEAVSQFSTQTDNETSSYNTPVNDADVKKQYDNLISESKNIWVLTGFQHSYLFKEWLIGTKNNPNESNLDALAKSNIVVIGVDWILDGLTKEQQEKLKGKIITLNYKTEESGWIAGYAAADYLGKKFPGMAPEQRAKRGIASFGGHPGKGVTDFITGFFGGIKEFNQEEENADKKALITSDPITTDVNFDIQDQSKIKVVQDITTIKKPAIILPVAGSFTNTVVQTIVTSNSDQSIIGVDTDQSKAFVGKESSLFITSIEKRIGATIYRVLVDLFTKKEKSDIISDFNKMPKIENVKLGYWDGFVSLSKSTKPGEEQDIINASLEKAINKFKQFVPQEKKAEASKLLKIVEMVDIAPAGQTVKQVNEAALNALIAEINK